MPRQARVYIKTAFVQLLISLFMGALLLINAGLRWQSGLNVLLLVYYHLLMVGWATQLIGGVALWMFPVHSRERPRGDERLGWIAYGALNGGLLIRAIAEPIHTLEPRDWSAWGLVGAALLQVCAVWILVVTLWSRVKGRSETRRPRPGDV